MICKKCGSQGPFIVKTAITTGFNIQSGNSFVCQKCGTENFEEKKK